MTMKKTIMETTNISNLPNVSDVSDVSKITSDVSQVIPTYILNNVKQIFEINKKLKTFKSKFMVKSLNNEPFYGIIIDQENLDSGKHLDYKYAEKGVFSGEITQENETDSLWYLVLKSPSPNKVSVQIETIPLNPPNSSLNSSPNQQLINPNQLNLLGINKKSKIPLFVIFLIVLGGGIGIYFLLNKFILKKSENNFMDNLKNNFIPQPVQPLIPSVPSVPSVPPVPSVIIPEIPMEIPKVPEIINTKNILGKDLLEQINNLPS